MRYHIFSYHQENVCVFAVEPKIHGLIDILRTIKRSRPEWLNDAGKILLIGLKNRAIIQTEQVCWRIGEPLSVPHKRSSFNHWPFPLETSKCTPNDLEANPSTCRWFWLLTDHSHTHVVYYWIILVGFWCFYTILCPILADIWSTNIGLEPSCLEAMKAMKVMKKMKVMKAMKKSVIAKGALDPKKVRFGFCHRRGVSNIKQPKIVGDS